MKGKQLVAVVTAALLAMALAGCGKAEEAPKAAAPQAQQAASGKVLTAIKTAKAPNIDGVADDTWNAAQTVKTSLTGAGTLGPGGVFNNGNTNVSMKALYDDKNIYMLFEWEDPNDSQARGPWIKEGDKLVKKPYSTHYEDKFAVLWNVNNSTKDFNEKGCAISCHDTGTKNKDGKPVLKHWTNGPDEILDTWHLKMTRHNTLFGADKPGIMHDQYHDNTKFDPNDPKTSAGGRKRDPETAKEYEDNITGPNNADPGMPKLVFDGAPVNGSKYVIVNGLDKVKPFTPDMVAAMKEGDTIPGLMVNPQTEDSGDVKAKAKWANGKWVLEIQRPLKTGSKYDVQFEADKNYFFGVAAFDNSQIGHATMAGTLELKFQK